MACRPLNSPSRFDQKRVLREKCGHCRCVVLVVCLVQLPMKLTGLINCLGNPEKITLLGCSWIGCVLLLGEGRQSKADCQPD